MRNLSGLVLLLAIGMATMFYRQPSNVATTPKTSLASVKGDAGAKGTSSNAFPEALVTSSDSYLIVLVPDPSSTGLNLLLDRWLDSLQKGARLHRYLGDRHWFPENARNNPDALAGMLSFWRNSDERRLTMLLVGESPAYGVDRAGLAKALERSFSNGEQLEAIIGPAFSGGYRSLGVALDDFAAKRKALPRVRVITGSATNATASHQLAPTKVAVDAQRAIEDDDRALLTFASFFEGRSLRRQDYLVLGESTTAYGTGARIQFCQGCSRFLPRAFPREIAQLRAAYDASDSSAKTSNNPLRGIGIRPTRTESGSASDLAPMFAPGQTLATQDANLRALADSFRDSRMKWFSTRATNPLDNVFLREFFMREAPQLNLVLTESDPLFSYSPESQSFFGTLAISSNKPFHSPADAAESSTDGVDLEGNSKLGSGVTNAVFRGLDSAAPLADLSPQMAWISIIGTHGYWPIAWTRLLSGGESLDPSIDAGLPMELTGRNEAMRYLPKVALLTAMFIAVLVLRATWRFLSLYRNVLQDFRKPRKDLTISGFYHLKLICLTGLFVALSLSLLLVIAPAAALNGSDKLVIYALMVVAGVSVAMSILAVVLFLRRRAEQWGMYLIELGLISGGICFAVYFLLLVYGTPESYVSFFFNYRAVHFESGVSPVLPLVLIMLSLAICGKVQFGRFDLAELASVQLPTLNYEALRKVQNDVSNVIDWMYTRSSLLTFVSVIGGFWSYLALKKNPLSIEGNDFDILIFFILTLSNGLIAGSLMIFWQAWRHLHNFLDLTEHTPLRGTFVKLPADLGSVAVFQGLKHERNLLFLDRARDSWLRLGEASGWKSIPEYKDLTERINLAMSKLEMSEGRGLRDHDCQRIEVQKLFDECLRIVQQAFPKLWIDDIPDIKSDFAGDKNLDLAREFVAFRFISFIRYSLIQLREQLSYFGGAFLLQTVALSSYPFLATTSVKNYLFVTFIMLAGFLTFSLWQMGRNVILQKLSSDDKNSSNPVLRQSLQVGALPIIGFLGAYFPSLGNLLFSWVYPALEKLQ